MRVIVCLGINQYYNLSLWFLGIVFSYQTDGFFHRRSSEGCCFPSMIDIILCVIKTKCNFSLLMSSLSSTTCPKTFMQIIKLPLCSRARALY